MGEKSPAFSFYAKDFLMGTVTMSLAERGAYVTLLAYQWDAGAVPTDPAAMARLLACTPAQARKLWQTVGSKFEQGDDGYINTRLEQERVKQSERRQKLALNGSKGGAIAQAIAQAKAQAREKQLPEQLPEPGYSLPSSSSSTEISTGTYGGADAPRFPQPVEKSRKTPSQWKRAIAIAHAVIEAWPDNRENWTYETKGRLQEQHLDPQQRSPRGGALFQDAVDYAVQQRQERAARKRRAS